MTALYSFYFRKEDSAMIRGPYPADEAYFRSRKTDIVRIKKGARDGDIEVVFRGGTPWPHVLLLSPEETYKAFEHKVDAVDLATGYEPGVLRQSRPPYAKIRRLDLATGEEQGV